jgi:hypothetical protein
MKNMARLASKWMFLGIIGGVVAWFTASPTPAEAQCTGAAGGPDLSA